ncbi:MAG TPA: hypothetical protein H9815_11945 [Candidatus Ruania gallistercoris]|uniref:Uncharacterized protein n=1 Tax=Candidatus Ruania gallistercoris TaxID=2838746 RepID=A0A9D2EFQ5_9MICO|nr:hypothetical protein [Candidatus Ruania gallistercoris]
MTVDQALAQLTHTGFLAVRYERGVATARQIGSVIALVFVIVVGLFGLIRIGQVTEIVGGAEPAGTAVFAGSVLIVAGLIGLTAWLVALSAAQAGGQEPGLVLTAQGAAVGAPGRRAKATVAWPAVTEVRAVRMGERTRVLIMSGKKGKSVPVHLELGDEQLYALVSSAHRMFGSATR